MLTLSKEEKHDKREKEFKACFWKRFSGFFLWLLHNMSDWICAWLTVQSDSLKLKCTNINSLSLGSLTPLTGRGFWEFHLELWVTPVLSQECQTGWSGRPGCSSAAVRLTPSDVLFVVLSSRSVWILAERPDSTFQHVGTHLTSRVVSRILHLSGHQIPLCWLTVINAAMNNHLGVNNLVLAPKMWVLQLDWYKIWCGCKKTC